MTNRIALMIALAVAIYRGSRIRRRPPTNDAPFPFGKASRSPFGEASRRLPPEKRGAGLARPNLVLVNALAVVLAGCGGGSGYSSGQAPAGTTPVTLHFADGRVSGVGFYQTGTTTLAGHWQKFFDDPSGRKQWEGEYVAGAIDNGKPWREWNLDGSIRNDQTD